jgi:hypothetical protein
MKSMAGAAAMSRVLRQSPANKELTTKAEEAKVLEPLSRNNW